VTDTHPLDALELLRTGKVEVAIIFRYDETEPEPVGVRLHPLLDDPVHLLSTRREPGLAGLRDATWIAGCERCRSHLLSLCADAGFEPRIAHRADSLDLVEDLVVAGFGVGLLPADQPPRPGVRLLELVAPAVVLRCYAVVRRGRRSWPPLALVLDRLSAAPAR